MKKRKEQKQLNYIDIFSKFDKWSRYVISDPHKIKPKDMHQLKMHLEMRENSENNFKETLFFTSFVQLKGTKKTYSLFNLLSAFLSLFFSFLWLRSYKKKDPILYHFLWTLYYTIIISFFAWIFSYRISLKWGNC